MQHSRHPQQRPPWLHVFYQHQSASESAFTGPEGGVTGSKVSIADSIRGLGRARADATTPVNNSGGSGLPRYGYGKYYGRDGKQHIGVDRVGRPGIPDMVIRM